MRHPRIAAGAASLVLSTLWAVPTLAQASTTESTVTRLATEYLAAWNAHDVDRAAGYFDKPSGWFMTGGLVMPTVDSLRSFFRGALDLRTSDDLKWSRTHVRTLGADAAFFQGVYGGRAAFKDGRVIEWQDNGLMTALFERRGGTWKITAAHFSAGAGRPVGK